MNFSKTAIFELMHGELLKNCFVGLGFAGVKQVYEQVYLEKLHNITA